MPLFVVREREGCQKRDKPEDLPDVMKDKLREKAVPMIPYLSRTYRNLLLSLWITGLFIVLGSCSQSPQQREAVSVQTDSTIFSDRVEVQYAEGFRISYHSNYKVLEILNPFQDITDTLRYVLKPRDVSLREEVRDARVIDIPVRSMIATSTTHIGLTQMLDSNSIIKGMTNAGFVFNRQIRNGLDNGEIISFSGGELNREQALALDPDLIMISGGQSAQYGNYKVLMESGINIVVNSEWLETTPLGKAEWVKMMAALLNRETRANEEFEKVAARYNELKERADGVAEKPLVINNLPYKGDWFMPGGDSFIAQYLKDAGADYPWFDHHTSGGLRLNFEVVYEAGLRADVWLNPGAVQSKEELLAKDTRFKSFKSFGTGEIYNNNQRVNPSGGNDYWESGVVHPEIVLADLIRIFHPSLLPRHELYYYRRVNSHE